MISVFMNPRADHKILVTVNWERGSREVFMNHVCANQDFAKKWADSKVRPVLIDTLSAFFNQRHTAASISNRFDAITTINRLRTYLFDPSITTQVLIDRINRYAAEIRSLLPSTESRQASWIGTINDLLTFTQNQHTKP